MTDAGGADLNTKTGKLTYLLTLLPNESRTLMFRYELKYPKGRTIVQ